MSDAARNFRVGIFVFAGALAIGACAVVLGGQDLFAPRIRFESYFDEAATGLEVGAPVRFRGVKIGTVRSIGLVEDYYDFETEQERIEFGQRVSVLMEYVITREEDVELRDLSYEEHRERLELRVEQGLRLRIASAGITGISFIQADYLDPELHPKMEITWTPRHIYIPSAPSTIAALTSAAERIAGRLENVDVVGISEHLDELILNMNETVTEARMSLVKEELVPLIAELRRTNRQLRTTLAAVNAEGISEDARAALAEATTTMAHARTLLDGTRYDLEQAIENTRVASENLRDLTENLKAQPSLVLRGEAPQEIQQEVSP